MSRINVGAGYRSRQTYPWDKIESDGGHQMVFRPDADDGAELGVGAATLQHALDKMRAAMIARNDSHIRKGHERQVFHAGLVYNEDFEDVVWAYGHPESQDCDERCDPDFLIEGA